MAPRAACRATATPTYRKPSEHERLSTLPRGQGRRVSDRAPRGRRHGRAPTALCRAAAALPRAPDRPPGGMGPPRARSCPGRTPRPGRRMAEDHLRADARPRAPHRPGHCRTRPVAGAADCDPLGQRPGALHAGPGRAMGRCALHAGVGGLFDDLAGLRQAEADPRHADPGPGVRRRRACLPQRDRHRGAARDRDLGDDR